MELYLDSANLREIEEGFKLGFLNGLTTMPTFMQREGIADVDFTYNLYGPSMQLLYTHNYQMRDKDEDTYTISPLLSVIPSGIITHNFVFSDGSSLSIPTLRTN